MHNFQNQSGPSPRLIFISVTFTQKSHFIYFQNLCGFSVKLKVKKENFQRLKGCEVQHRSPGLKPNIWSERSSLKKLISGLLFHRVSHSKAFSPALIKPVRTSHHRFQSPTDLQPSGPPVNLRFPAPLKIKRKLQEQLGLSNTEPVKTSSVRLLSLR